MGALLSTAERVVRITSRGQVFEQVYLRKSSDKPFDALQKNIESDLVNIYSTSLVLLANSGTLLASNTTGRILEAIIHPGKAAGDLADIEKQEGELLKDVQVCEYRRGVEADERANAMLEALQAPMGPVSENVSKLLDHIGESERISMLEWISPIQFGKHHDNVKDNRTPGTGKWILNHEEFRVWEQKKSSVLFWLQGDPGTGKTYLTSSVIDHIRAQVTNPPKDEGFAFFYCDRDDPPRTKPLSVLQSFVRQLSTTASNPGAIQIKLQEACKEARESGTDFRLGRCKEQIQASLNIYQRTTLVIDAMDECDRHLRYQLIDALNEFLMDSKKPVKIFISSRPDPTIEHQLESTPNIGIQAGDNQDDIKKFLEEELNILAKSATFFENLKPEIIATLLERCQGMFQWANLQVQQLFECSSASAVRYFLVNLPAGLKESYDKIWSQIENQIEPEQVIIKRALRWAMAASKPLTSTEMLAAIRVDEDGNVSPLADSVNEEGLASLCKNLLVIDYQMKVWRFSHLSVREYLECKEDWSIPKAHYHAATVCLSYMVNKYDHDLEPSVELEEGDEGYPGESDNGFATLHPFHLYMRHFWHYHVTQAKNTEVAKLGSILKQFLGSPNESSLQYRRWHAQIKSDFDMLFPRTNYEYCITWDTLNSVRETGPSDASIFAMCRFKLETTLSDWWDNADIDIFRVNDEGHSLLAIAASAGSVSICKTLVGRGMDVNARRRDPACYGTALVAAAHAGETDVVKYLVETGAQVNLLLEAGEGIFNCALEAAIRSGNPATVRYLVNEAKSDVHISLPRSSTRYPLGEAVVEDSVEILKILIEEGADVNKVFTGEMYGSALVAACNINLESVKCLIKAGADPNLQLLAGKYGSALLQACMTDFDIAKYLVKEANADPNMTIKHGRFGSALAGVSYEEADVEIVQFLVNSGADVNKPLPYGDFGSALAAGAAGKDEGDMDVFGYLVSAGADVNMRLEGGLFGNALAAAVWARIHYKIKILLDAKVDLDMTFENRDFGSALALAAAFGYDDGAVGLLVDAGANVNVKTSGKYASPLIAAACLGQKKCVEYLIRAGADVNLKADGTPYATALQAARLDISDHKPWIFRFYPNEDDVEAFSEEWAEEEPGIVELLQKHGATA